MAALRIAERELQVRFPDAVLLDPGAVNRLLDSGELSIEDARAIVSSIETGDGPLFYSAALDWIGDQESFAQFDAGGIPPEPPPRLD